MFTINEYSTDAVFSLETLAVWENVSTELKRLILEVDKVQQELDNILLNYEN